MLRRVEKRLLAGMVERAERVKLRATAALEKTVAEAWAAWERTKLPTPTCPAPRGDLGCLQEARAAIADLRKVWGTDAPTRTELKSNMPVLFQTNIYNELDDASVEQLRRIRLTAETVSAEIKQMKALPAPAVATNVHVEAEAEVVDVETAVEDRDGDEDGLDTYLDVGDGEQLADK